MMRLKTKVNTVLFLQLISILGHFFHVLLVLEEGISQKFNFLAVVVSNKTYQLFKK